MSSDDVINAFNEQSVAVTPQSNIMPLQQKSMIELVREKGGVIPERKPVDTQSNEVMSGAEEIEQLWKTDVSKSDTHKRLEDLTPEDFKKGYFESMGKLDQGERSKLESFIFGDTAQEANPLQAFARGARGELEETSLGIAQRLGIGEADEQEANRKQTALKQQTNYPNTTTAGKIAGTMVELAPLAAIGVGAAPLLAEGAAYGFTRPQEEGYTAGDVALTTGGEALLSLVGGKATKKLVDTAGPILKNIYSKITGAEPKGLLINSSGEPSQELIDALEEQGLTYNQLINESGVFDQIKASLKAQPANVKADQAVRAARYEALGITPTKSSVSQGFDDAVESQVLRRQINEPEAASLRDALADESQGFKDSLSNLADETGDPDFMQAGETVRTAIKGRMKDQRTLKSESYKKLAEEAELIGKSLPINSDSISEAWGQTKRIKRSQMSPLHSDVKESLMRYGVIEPDESFLKMIDKGDEELVDLSAKNFETLRQELNANINPQDPATSAILKPIIKSLDKSVDFAAESAEQSAKLSDLSKEARGNAREFAIEFNSKDMVNDILKTKKGTFDTYQIRGQDIFNKLIKTSQKTATAQQLTEVISTLEKSGAKGQKAIADLQSATIMNLLNDATSQLSAKGMKGQQFSYTAFRKSLEGMGDKELGILFKNNKQGLNKLKELGKAAKDSQTFFDAIPKGSAADLQNMFTRSFAPLFETIGFAKGGFLGKLAAQTIVEKGGERISKSRLRKAVAAEIRAKPEIRTELTKLTKQYPGVFESLGIALADKTIRQEQPDKK